MPAMRPKWFDSRYVDSRDMPLFSVDDSSRKNVALSKSRSSRSCSFLALYFLTSASYTLSLRGASSPADMNAIQGYLGFLLVVSVACFSAHFWMSLASGHWMGHFALQLCTLAAWYLLNNGNRLQHHGAYNMLVFLMPVIPTNAILGIFHVWYWAAAGAVKPRRFWCQILFVMLALAVLVRIVVVRKEATLKYGLFGKQSVCEEPGADCNACRWDHAMPWLYLVPFRLNFFTGPMTCLTDDSFSAYFGGNRLVIEGCDLATEVRSYFNDSILFSFPGPAYSILPRTEAWDLRLKRDTLDSEDNEFQRNVIRFAEANTKPYLGPTVMHMGRDTILARCGSAGPKLVHRVGASAVIANQGTESKLALPLGDGLNVVTIFIDAVSRSQLHRSLPNMRRTLESITRSHPTSIYEFFRYHTIGLNTGPNTRALWAGLSEHDNSASGMPLWEEFERAGYISARINPMCQDWDAFYNTQHLTRNSSASALLIPARISHEYLSFSCFPPYLPLGKNANGNFAGAYSLKARCISGTHLGWHELDWAASFIDAYATPRPSTPPEPGLQIQKTPPEEHTARPYYLHATFMEGHEGSGAVLATLDARLAAFLDPATSPLNFSNTAVALLSDHGALMGFKSALLANGRIEAANPAAVLVLPDAWTARAGRAATGRLVTAHDLHETLRGFMGAGAARRVVWEGGGQGEGEPEGEGQGQGQGQGESESESESEGHGGGEGHARRGFDLAREPLGDRTCAEAGITEVACRCN